MLFWHFRFQSFSIFSFKFRFSFHHFFVSVLGFVNEFVIFSFFTIFVLVFVNENHTDLRASVTRQYNFVLAKRGDLVWLGK